MARAESKSIGAGNARDAVVRLAMWSGPRNISTAMMRSWGNRPDTFVCDEPLYAHYLARTGLDHPGAQEVLAAHEGDWRNVVAWLTGPVPEGRRIFYQKQMAHHLLPEIDRDWLGSLTHVFLIREPQAMLLSLLHHIPEPTLEDTGLPQQVEIFETIRRESGRMPPVTDSRDVLEDPGRVLRGLCDALEVPFFPEMLSWPAGPRHTDGIWARHWYGQVLRSTGFRPRVDREERLPSRFQDLLSRCREHYDHLYSHRLSAD